MDKIDIENEILKHFYSCWEIRATCSLTKVYQKLNQIEEKTIERIGDGLERSGFIEGLLAVGRGEITARGIIEAEKRDIIPIEKLRRNADIRFYILEYATDFYEMHGDDEPADDDEIISKYGLTEHEYYNNFGFLEKCYLVTGDAIRTFYIEPSGVRQYQIWRQRRHFLMEFESLKNLTDMTPQKRGSKLEQLVADLAAFAGWQQEKNVKTSNEQIDVIIHNNREFYLIECKWVADPAEAETVDKLFGKLSRRVGAKGILLSVSGFTSGSVKNVEDSTTQTIILLFGPKDLESIVANPELFETILDHKYKELIMRRKADWN